MRLRLSVAPSMGGHRFRKELPSVGYSRGHCSELMVVGGHLDRFESFPSALCAGLLACGASTRDRVTSPREDPCLTNPKMA